MTKILVTHTGAVASDLYIADLDRDDELKDTNLEVPRYLSPGDAVLYDLNDPTVFRSYDEGTMRGFIDAGFLSVQQQDNTDFRVVKVSVDSLTGDNTLAAADPLNVPFAHPQAAIDWGKETLADDITLEVHIGWQVVDIGPPIVVRNGWSTNPIFGSTVEDSILLINRSNTNVFGYNSPAYGDGNNTFDAVVIADVDKDEFITWYNAGGASWDVDADGIYTYTGEDFSAFTTAVDPVSDVKIRNLAPSILYAFGAQNSNVDDVQVDACTLRDIWFRGVKTAYFGPRNTIIPQTKGYAFVESVVDWDVENSIASLDDGTEKDIWVYANKNDSTLGPAESNAGWGVQDSGRRTIPGDLAFDGHAANTNALFHCQDLHVHRNASFRYFKMDSPGYPVRFQNLDVGGDLTLFGGNVFRVDRLSCEDLVKEGTTLTVNGGTVRGTTTITDGNADFNGVVFVGAVTLDTDGTVNFRGCEIMGSLIVNGAATVNVLGGSVFGGTTDNSGATATITRDAGA